MDWQMIIVSAVILAAVAYIVVRIRKTVSSSDDPCRNCGCCETKKHQKPIECGKCQGVERNNSKNLQE